MELGREESLLDLLEEELTASAFELGRNGLRLHADSHVWHRALAVRLESARKKTAESGLSGSVLSHHDNDLRVGEVARVNSQVEVA